MDSDTWNRAVMLKSCNTDPEFVPDHDTDTWNGKASATQAGGFGLNPGQSCHTKDSHKNGTRCILAHYTTQH